MKMLMRCAAEARVGYIREKVRTLDVVAQNLTMTLGTALSETLEEHQCQLEFIAEDDEHDAYLATFSTARHCVMSC